MRNYLFSTAVHVILLLLLLGLSFSTVKNEPKEVNQAIIVDFTHREEAVESVSKTKESEERKPTSESVAPSPPKEKAKKVVERAKKIKTIEKKTLQTSQKPNAESSKVLEEESNVAKKVIPSADPKPTKEEIAEAERRKKKEEKLSHFKSLLSKAKNHTAADQDQPETSEEVSGSDAGTSSATPDGNKNIQGVLGNRKVLKTPTIVDRSQKKGRVVVKICVNDTGKVISSKYTMMGSTTSDTYLIGLAEKGARQYVFSPSDNKRECGNVVIDFQLK